MAYVRNEWKENDIITAEKLNNLEEGCDDILEISGLNFTDGLNVKGQQLPEEVFNKLNSNENLIGNCKELKILVNLQEGTEQFLYLNRLSFTKMDNSYTVVYGGIMVSSIITSYLTFMPNDNSQSSITISSTELPSST